MKTEDEAMVTAITMVSKLLKLHDARAAASTLYDMDEVTVPVHNARNELREFTSDEFEKLRGRVIDHVTRSLLLGGK